MKVGLIKEIKSEEYRVGLTPEGVAALVTRGHQVSVEKSAGLGSGYSDQDYQQAGADIVGVEQAWDRELVIKVKEPIEAEYQYLKQQIVFTYFHLAGVPKALTEALLNGKTTAVAYETLEDQQGRLPLLAPMSAVAGNMAVQMGCHYLARCNGGKGVMLGSVLGKRHGNVLIIGDGVVGSHAARTAVGLGANVTVAGLFPENAARLQREVSPEIGFIVSEPATIAEHVKNADLVVGAVLIHGARAAHVVTAQMVQTMQPGSVIVDVSIDQGGCIETAHATTHLKPVYEKYGVIHYCVSNMPGAFPRTATMALTDATLPYVLKLADQGMTALSLEPEFAKALNTCQGFITCQPAAEALSLLDRYKSCSELLATL
ncbi:alanine dehydrogenase [Methylomonas methanica]|uniref:Alanine dehydrogenase n=1 Tax=Methylomonas methanica (strain DSM 25384 / MC09) TaxID=857087 RepID=G0A625_METMM|nr:alanine dehydrogenase [Methylomonas methanica]AEG00475.1 alanine dehydrogenase [Methylomonas methanica MC09]